MSGSSEKPSGELAIRVLTMPSQTNPNGDIFGGWLVSQMDLAGLSVAGKHSSSRVTTVAIDKMSFLAPVHVGNFICCYADLVKIGRTSITVKIEAWSVDMYDEKRRKVTEGIFTYVAIDDNHRPIPVNR